MAMQADKELTSNGKSPEKLKAAGSLLMKVFGVLAVSFLSLCYSFTFVLSFFF